MLATEKYIPQARDGTQLLTKPDPGAVTAASIHDMRQPLNVMALTLGNIRMRMEGCLLPDDAAYLAGKVLTLEMQIARLSALVEQLSHAADGD